MDQILLAFVQILLDFLCLRVQVSHVRTMAFLDSTFEYSFLGQNFHDLTFVGYFLNDGIPCVVLLFGYLENSDEKHNQNIK